jgi:hypothetical protein
MRQPDDNRSGAGEAMCAVGIEDIQIRSLEQHRDFGAPFPLVCYQSGLGRHGPSRRIFLSEEEDQEE